MSASCLSKASSLELSLSFEGGPCAETAVRVDAARLQSRCRVSVETLTVFAFSVLASTMLNTKSRRTLIALASEAWAVSSGLTSWAIGSGGGI